MTLRYRFLKIIVVNGVILLALLVILALPRFPALAATLTVTNANDSGPGSLRQAIADAAPGDTITFDLDYTIVLSSELVIAQSLTIDGQTHQITISGDNAYRVFRISSGNVTLAHLTIANGYVAGNGGGIRNSGTLTITHSVLRMNSATGDGGAIYNFLGTLTVQNSTLILNSALNGGGLSSLNGTVTIQASGFDTNSATDGGGIFTNGTTLTLQTSGVARNTATTMGGGIESTGTSAVTIDQSTLSENSAPTGGGFANWGGTVTVTASTLSDNLATNGAGIYNYSFSTLTVQNSTLSGNLASSHGGGLYTQSTAGVCTDTPLVTVRNSTFSGDSAATAGGAIYNLTGVIELTASTISANSSSANQGGGVWSANNNTTCTRVGSTIIAGNSGADVSAGAAPTQRYFTLGYNLLGAAGANVEYFVDFLGDSDLISVTNPLLAPLADYGGATWTHALLPGSPALDLDGFACPLPDQRGIARPQGSACDIGAYESRGFTLAKASGDNQATPINTDFASLLVVNVTNNYAEPVDGGEITFTGPGTGAGLTPTLGTATIINGTASRLVTANGTAGGPYAVQANALGTTSVSFALTNLPACASVTVTNNADSGAGSLRQALALACEGGIIKFNGDYTITLSSALGINKSLTIDGEAHRIVISGQHATRIFNVTAGNVTFAHLTIADGNANLFDCDSNSSRCGGGIMLQNSSVAVTVTHSTLSGNAGHEWGGGIGNWYGKLTVQNSVFSGNSASDGGYGGGGIGTYYGTVTVMSSTFSSNPASYGGGLSNWYGTVTVVSSTFASNPATQGGGLANSAGTLIVTSSTFLSNTATNIGGGLLSFFGTATIHNSTLSANSAPMGGGFYNGYATLRVINNTLSGNSASVGGGLYNESSGTLHLINSLIANSPTGGDCIGALATNDHNLIEGNGNACDLSNGAGGSLIGVDPLLGPLANNGGGVQTFALLSASPAIDAGHAASCLAIDQRGETRADLACDIGAYELKYTDSHTVTRAIVSTTLTTFGPTVLGLRRDAGWTDPGVMTVTKEAWSTQGPESVDALWAISPSVSSGFSLTLQVCLTPAEMNGLSLGSLFFYRSDGLTYTKIITAPTWSMVNGNHCAALSGITQLSRWTLATASPTAMTLSHLSAAARSAPIGWVEPIGLGVLVALAVSGGGLIIASNRHRRRSPRR